MALLLQWHSMIAAPNMRPSSLKSIHRDKLSGLDWNSMHGNTIMKLAYVERTVREWENNTPTHVHRCCGFPNSTDELDPHPSLLEQGKLGIRICTIRYFLSHLIPRNKYQCVAASCLANTTRALWYTLFTDKTQGSTNISGPLKRCECVGHGTTCFFLVSFTMLWILVGDSGGLSFCFHVGGLLIHPNNVRKQTLYTIGRGHCFAAQSGGICSSQV